MTTNPHQPLLDQLTQLWHEGIPLAKAMGIEATAYNGVSFTTEVPEAPNQNHHGSQFAGSIFSQATLTGWGLIWMAMQHQGLEGTIVLASSEIRYRKPIVGALPCQVDAEDINLAALNEGLNAKVNLTIKIGDCAEFHGRYAVLPL